VDDFAAYAEVVYSRFGSKVSKWFTVNEPIVFWYSLHPPSYKQNTNSNSPSSTYPLPKNYFKATTIPPVQQRYFCGQSVLLAHAKAYHLGKSLMPNSTISFKTNGGYKIPLTNSSSDAIATQRAWDFNEGWFANPIFINGNYPKYLAEYVSGFLRPLNSSEKESLVNTSDVYAHDAYTSQFYYAPDSGIDACTSNSSHPLYPSCVNTTYTYAANSGGWNIGPAADPGSPWLHKATDWVPAFLAYIQKTWNPPQGIAVTEFGFAEPFEELKTLLPDIQFDPIRSAYYHDYMRAILMAISEGTRVVGALAWSIMDNLEWSAGYTIKFGMQYVNMTTYERHYKASFFEYVDAFKQYQEE
jgi:beta-glucosidase/6-phospho-beta-glucosidase/beta-galactosidase